MSDSLIIGALAFAGSLVGSLLTFISSRKKDNSDKLRIIAKNMCEQVASYSKIESLYIEEIARLRSACNEKCFAEKAIKVEFRKKIRDADSCYENITETECSARKKLKSLE